MGTISHNYRMYQWKGGLAGLEDIDEGLKRACNT
jgi:hypothetical protein